MEDIKKFETMSKLDLPDIERQWVKDRADKMLAGFSALQNIDTSGVNPLISVLDITNVLRDDVAKKFITRDELLSNAPEQYDGYFQVPKTLD